MDRLLTTLRRGFTERIGWKRVGIAASLIIVAIAIAILVRTLKGIDSSVILVALAEKSHGQIALAALCVFVPQGAVIWKVGLVMGACNLVGGYLGARTAVARGVAFVRIFFIVVVSGFVVRIGAELLGVW